MSKHTQGPWVARLDSGELFVQGADGSCVLWTGSFGDVGTLDNEADAPLIASAPELLAALEGMVAVYASIPDHFLTSAGPGTVIPALGRHTPQQLKAARAAIAKATA